MLTKHATPAFYYALLLHLIVLMFLMMRFNSQLSTATFSIEKNTPRIINAQVFVNAATEKMPPSSKVASHIKEPVLPKAEKPAPVTKKPLMPQKNILAKKVTPKLKPKPVHKEAAFVESFAKELQQMTQKSLANDVLLAKKQLEAKQLQKTNGMIDQYRALILQAISQNWLIPAGVDKNLTAELMVRLAPGGTVLEVILTKSSGDVALDRSVKAAIYKASPLPVPTDAAFEPFRQFVLKVKPEDVMNV